MNQQQGSHQLVRSAIHIFIIVAIGISLYQQLSFNSNKNQTPIAGQVTPQNLQPTGPKIMGIAFKITQKFNKPIKQLLAKSQLNIQVGAYQFQGNQYWFNFILNWGHIALVYILIGKYKSQVNEATKKKIMIGGAVAVLAWFLISSNIKPQRISIQIEGSNVYEKDFFNQNQINDILIQHQFNDDEVATQTGKVNLESNEHETGTYNKNQIIAQHQAPKIEEQLIEEEIF